MPVNNGERRLGHGNKEQFHRRSERRTHKDRLKPVEFGEYNGWANFPSWDVFTVMTSYYDTYQTLYRIADQGTPLAVRDFVTSTVQYWKEDKVTPHAEAARARRSTRTPTCRWDREGLARRAVRGRAACGQAARGPR